MQERSSRNHSRQEQVDAAARAEHYRKQAEDCLLQAERSKYEDHKAAWLKLAAQWLGMAEDAEKTDRERSVSKQREALVAILGRKPKPADCPACLIGDMHFPNVASQEFSIHLPQHLAGSNDRLPVRLLAAGKLNSLTVRQVFAIVNVEKVSRHSRDVTRAARIRINLAQCKNA